MCSSAAVHERRLGWGTGDLGRWLKPRGANRAACLMRTQSAAAVEFGIDPALHPATSKDSDQKQLLWRCSMPLLTRMRLPFVKRH
jgi:hypothetical protein